MQIIKSKEFKPANAWDALPIANMNGVTTRLHWTDKPYKWHTNDGEEVFVVLDGQVEMSYRIDGIEHMTLLNGRCSIYVLVNIFTPPNNHDFASLCFCSHTRNHAK